MKRNFTKGEIREKEALNIFPVNVVQAPNVENNPDSDGINPDIIVHFNGKDAKITR